MANKYQELNEQTRREIRDRALGNAPTNTPAPARASLSFEEILDYREKLFSIGERLNSPAGDGHQEIFALQTLLKELLSHIPALHEDIEWVQAYSVTCYQRMMTRNDLAMQVSSLCQAMSGEAEQLLAEERRTLVQELRTAREFLAADEEFTKNLFANGVFSEEVGEAITDALLKARHPRLG